MTQVGIFDDRIVVAATDSFVGETTGRFEFGDDALHRTLGDTDDFGYLALANVDVSSDGEQHMGVVGQELPGSRNFHDGQRRPSDSGDGTDFVENSCGICRRYCLILVFVDG